MRVQWSDIAEAARRVSEELNGSNWVTAGIEARVLLADLADEIERLRLVEQERDALRASIDRYVNDSIHGYSESGPWFVSRRLAGELFPTRAEAEAAYRKATGLDVAHESGGNDA
jgi:hypothetical protein